MPTREMCIEARGAGGTLIIVERPASAHAPAMPYIFKAESA
jgi:hypothetical protein